MCVCVCVFVCVCYLCLIVSLHVFTYCFSLFFHLCFTVQLSGAWSKSVMCAGAQSPGCGNRVCKQKQGRKPTQTQLPPQKSQEAPVHIFFHITCSSFTSSRSLSISLSLCHSLFFCRCQSENGCGRWDRSVVVCGCNKQSRGHSHKAQTDIINTYKVPWAGAGEQTVGGGDVLPTQLAYHREGDTPANARG